MVVLVGSISACSACSSSVAVVLACCPTLLGVMVFLFPFVLFSPPTAPFFSAPAVVFFARTFLISFLFVTGEVVMVLVGVEDVVVVVGAGADVVVLVVVVVTGVVFEAVVVVVGVIVVAGT